jgi:hypothetical protein
MIIALPKLCLTKHLKLAPVFPRYTRIVFSFITFLICLMVSKLQGEEMLKELFSFLLETQALHLYRCLVRINTITLVRTIYLHTHTRIISRCKITAKQSPRWIWTIYNKERNNNYATHSSLKGA